MTYLTETNTQEPRDQTLTCKSQDGIHFAFVVHLICIFGCFVPRGLEGFTSSTREKTSKEMNEDVSDL